MEGKANIHGGQSKLCETRVVLKEIVFLLKKIAYIMKIQKMLKDL